MIRKWGDVKFPPSVLQLLDDLDTLMNIEFQLFDEHHVDFITEAVPRDELNRRVDLVRLSDNQYYEFENDKKRAKKGSVTVVL